MDKSQNNVVFFKKQVEEHSKKYDTNLALKIQNNTCFAYGDKYVVLYIVKKKIHDVGGTQGRR